MAGPAAPEAAPRSVRRETRRRLARVSPAARAHLAATVALGLVSTTLVVAQATLLAHVVARVFLGGATAGDVASSLWWLAAVSIARGLVAAGFETAGRYGAARVMSGLRGRLVRHLLLARPGNLHDEQAGELAATAVQGVDSLEAYFARYLPQAILSVLAPPLILIWVLPRNWESAAILAVTVPLIPVFMVLIGMAAEQRARRRWGVLAALGARFLDVVSGLETVRAFGRERAAVQAIDDAGERYRSETMATLRIGFLSALVLELLATLGTALVAVTVGVQLAAGSLALEAGLTVLILAPELYAPLRELGAHYHAGADGLACAERILEVLDAPAGVTVREPVRDAPDPAYAAVSLTNVRFSYAGRGAPILDGMSLTLAPGLTTALVGPSGAGKTTVARIVARLADPQSGTVACGGVDLRHVDPRAWRARVAWVEQRPTMFAGTVEDNVRLARPEASSHDVARALSAAGATELVAALPDGARTRVGDGGRRLSAGQSRRIALARAFLDDAPLVVLDEPTAHLDPESAAAIEAAIERLAEGRTVLLATHRAELAARCDRVLELRDGRIAAAGTRVAKVAA
ncbi:MAG TPA: thiol reductant ABC exporter subunit CydD [Solirubrobacteraceae bacterium]